MSTETQDLPDRWDPEPRWPALIAILAVGGLYAALPAYLVVGPKWLFFVIVVALLAPTVITHRSGHHQLNRLFGFTVTSVVTLGMIASIILRCAGRILIQTLAAIIVPNNAPT
jgi:fatty acid desaturase